MSFSLKIFIRCILYLIAVSVLSGQTFPTLTYPVNLNNKLLLYPWTGGLNAPQILNADLNLDQATDVVIFDRAGGVWLPFVWENKLVYKPELRSLFPKLKEWVVFHDHNLDGIMDIFSYSTSPGLAGIDVYDGSKTSQTIQWTKRKFPSDRADILYYSSGNSRLNVYVSNIDYPAIEDIDRDGDLDILSFETGGGTIIMYKNLASEKKLAAGSFDFVIGDFCYGKLLEDGFSELITLSTNKDKCASGLLPLLEPRHSGSTLLTYDRDQDRDYDLLVGDISSPSLIYLKNAGDTSAAYMNEQELRFPTNSKSVDIPYFVSPFLADINNDKVREFFAASNFQFGSDNYNCLWRYDQDPGNAKNFVYVSNAFITDETIDFGENTYPALADVTGDGLLDMVVGSGGYFNRNGLTRASMFLFKNTGTSKSPAFQLIDTNWLNFRKYNSETNSFAPAFGDLDGDGDLDLLVGDVLGRLFYAQNTGSLNKPMSFPVISPEYFQIDVGQYSVPAIEDLDGDGKPDLIVGERNGNINFFKNTGSPGSAKFSAAPELENLGAIDTRVQGFATGNSSPFFIHSQKKLYLAVGTSGKNILFYDTPAANSNPFPLIKENWGSIREGDECHLAVADLDQDGKLDILIGNQRGGLAWYQSDLASDFSTSYKHEVSTKSLELYPNPCNHIVTITTGDFVKDGELLLYDLNGKLLLKNRINGLRFQLDVSAMLPGIFLVEVVTGGTIYKKKLAVLH